MTDESSGDMVGRMIQDIISENISSGKVVAVTLLSFTQSDDHKIMSLILDGPFCSFHATLNVDGSGTVEIADNDHDEALKLKKSTLSWDMKDSGYAIKPDWDGYPKLLGFMFVGLTHEEYRMLVEFGDQHYRIQREERMR